MWILHMRRQLKILILSLELVRAVSFCEHKSLTQEQFAAVSSYGASALPNIHGYLYSLQVQNRVAAHLCSNMERE